MKWLITGGCGFLGTNLIAYLKKQGGHGIRVIDKFLVGNVEDLERVTNFTFIKEQELANLAPPEAGECQLVQGDVMDAELALQVAKNMDVIIHLGGNTGVAPSVEDPRADCLANVIGTLNYLEAARHNQVQRFVFASSGAPVGEIEPPIHEELPPHPVSPYGASKLAGEGYCSAYWRTFGVETVALRFGNVYGPGSTHKNSVVAKFIKEALSGEVLEIYGDGTQTRDFIYIEDLLEAIQKAAITSGIGGELFQIATNTETTVSGLVDTLLPILERHGISGIEVTYGASRRGDVKRNFSDTSKAREQLGWCFSHTLDEGLDKTLLWFLKQITN